MLLLIALFLFSVQSQGAKVLIYQIAYGPSHLRDKVIVMYNSGVQSNGSLLLRKVHHIRVDPSPFMTMSHMTDPFKFTRHSRRLPEYMNTKKVFCQKLLNDLALLDTLKSERYDVFLSTPYDYCGLALRWHLQIPVQLGFVATAWDEVSFMYLGLPVPPSYVVDVFEDRVFNRPLNIADRLQSSLTVLDRWYDEYGVGKEEHDFIQLRFPGIPEGGELFKQYIYIFYNTNELLDLPRPISAKVKYIGGIVMNEELDRILDKPSKGNVVFSFGSLFRTDKISKELKKEFIKAFKSFKDYQFIWKLDHDDQEESLFFNSSNIVRMEWIPQTALLGDPRVKAFISHMGLNSYTELAAAGKPVIAIPLFVDQFYNTASALRNGIAINLRKDNITYNSVKEVLTTVLYQEKYAIKARKLAKMLGTRPLNPKQEFKLYFEYALENPDLVEVIQLDSAHLSFWKYLNLDLILLAILSFALVLTLSYRILCISVKVLLKDRLKKKKSD